MAETIIIEEGIQLRTPVILIDETNIALAPAAFITPVNGVTPCIGLDILRIFVYATQACIITVNQGVNDTEGPPLVNFLRDPVAFAVAALTPFKREVVLYGKFVYMTVQNNGAANGRFEVFAQMKARG